MEVLSGDKEERVELMTLLIRNLLKENKDLRTMVKNMASFVGDGESSETLKELSLIPTVAQVSDHAYPDSVLPHSNLTPS